MASGAETLPPAQREKLLGQLDEIQRLTKADAGQIALKFETIALDEIVRDVLPTRRFSPSPPVIPSTWPSVKKFKSGATGTGCASFC